MEARPGLILAQAWWGPEYTASNPWEYRFIVFAPTHEFLAVSAQRVNTDREGVLRGVADAHLDWRSWGLLCDARPRHSTGLIGKPNLTRRYLSVLLSRDRSPVM